MVPSDKVGVAFGVIQCESKDAVEILEKVGSLVLVKRENDFAVRLCLE